MESSKKESRVILAIQAIQNNPNLSARAAANIYSVSHATLSRRLKGTASQRDTMPKSWKLTDLEETAILQYILDLDARAFPPQLCHVEDMAN